MQPEDILSRRLSSQRLEGRRFSDPREAVGSFCAVQAQDFSGAAWAVCQRLNQVTAAGFANAFAHGDILRTHVMRPTWHLVAAEDIRWLTDLTRPRLLQSLGHYFRQFNLDKRALGQANDVILKALEGVNQLTRGELAACLARKRIDVQNGVRLSHILIHAEASGLICSGAPRGKQQTYALLDERAPHAKTLDREASLAELARRYFTSHGPATVDDYGWWSGLTKGEALAGLESVKQMLDHERVDGQMYWFGKGRSKTSSVQLEAHLLPNYDEYVVAYTDRGSLFDRRHTTHLDSRRNPLFNNVLILGGRMSRHLEKDRAPLQSDVGAHHIRANDRRRKKRCTRRGRTIRGIPAVARCDCSRHMRKTPRRQLA